MSPEDSRSSRGSLPSMGEMAQPVIIRRAAPKSGVGAGTLLLYGAMAAVIVSVLGFFIVDAMHIDPERRASIESGSVALPPLETAAPETPVDPSPSPIHAAPATDRSPPPTSATAREPTSAPPPSTPVDALGQAPTSGPISPAKKKSDPKKEPDAFGYR